MKKEASCSNLIFELDLRKTLLTLFTALLGMAAFVYFLGPATYTVDAFQVRLSISPFDLGITQISVPPVGSISAKTHAVPLKVSVILESIDLELLKDMVNRTGKPGKFWDEMNSRLFRIGGNFALRTLFLAAAGAAVGAYLAGERRYRLVVWFLIGLMIMGGLLAGTYFSYDVEGFSSPEYTGILRAAPWVVQAVQDSIAKVSNAREQMGNIAKNLYFLFGKLDTLGPVPGTGSDVTVLVMADSHNNPLMLPLIRGLVTSFSVDLVVDAGDLTDFGTGLEAELLQGIKSLGVPYVFAPGNHESPAVTEIIQGFPNVKVLRGKVEVVRGLPITGIPDPSSLRSEPAVASEAEVEEAKAFLRREIQLSQVKPFMLVAHDPRIAKSFIGTVPVVISGHTHVLNIAQQGGTVYINPGSAGAAGIRGLRKIGEIPYSAAILYVRKAGDDWNAVAVDTITLLNTKGGLVLERIPVETTSQEGNDTGASKD